MTKKEREKLRKAIKLLEDLDDEEAMEILRSLAEEGEQPGPAHLREEVSPQEWKEPSSTGAEKGGQLH